jgi:hypothetical protein
MATTLLQQVYVDTLIASAKNIFIIKIKINQTKKLIVYIN